MRRTIAAASSCLNTCEIAGDSENDEDRENDGDSEKDGDSDKEDDGRKDEDQGICIERFDVDFLQTTLTHHSPYMSRHWSRPLNSVEFTVFNIGEKKNEYSEKVRVWYRQDTEMNYFDSKTIRELVKINAGQKFSDMNDWKVHIDKPGITGVMVQLLNEEQSQNI